MSGRTMSYKPEQLNSVAMLLSLKRLLQELQSHDRQFFFCGVKFLMFHSQLFNVSALKSTKTCNPSFPLDLSIYEVSFYSNSSLA